MYNVRVVQTILEQSAPNTAATAWIAIPRRNDLPKVSIPSHCPSISRTGPETSYVSFSFSFSFVGYACVLAAVVRDCNFSGPESGEIVGLCVGGNTIHARRWKGQKTEIEWVNPPQTCLIVAKLSEAVGDVVLQAAQWMTSELNLRIYLEKEIWEYLPVSARDELQCKEVGAVYA